MSKRIGSSVTSVILIACILAWSFASPAAAGRDSTHEPQIDRATSSVAMWLEGLLSWLEGILMPEETRVTPECSLLRTTQDPAVHELPGEPGGGVTPQGGADIDPDG